MTGKTFYKSTFDEVNISEHMLTKLMVLKTDMQVIEKKTSIIYSLIKAVIAFGSVFAASGVLFSVPLL